MRLAIGTDHAGYDFKEALKAALHSLGHEIVDLGAHNKERCDYPDFALSVSRAVLSGQAQAGVLICGTGIGMSIAANKVKGIKAALCHDLFTARMSREHNDANIIVLPARMIAVDYAIEMMKVWVAAEYQGARHQGRLDKIREMENCG
jgi:RpiB/LacA/LacB family sugar-phosphate isomerase